MAVFKISRRDFYICQSNLPHLRREVWDRFDEGVLGLGDLTAPTLEREAVAGVFDLAGFTDFCKQIDPQLAISEYLAAFLNWLFGTIKRRSVEEPDLENHDDSTEVKALATLPFFAKFMGDGVLFLWDCAGLSEEAIWGIPEIAIATCHQYRYEFLPKISRTVSDPPTRLRCGLATGKVFSVGDGNDFVGPCINMAARLQKLSLLPIAFARRGFNEKYMNEHMRSHFVVKKVAVRGIGENELVYVEKNNFDALPANEKKLFREPDEEYRPQSG
jgi:class 3 adenylate cyclase